MKPGFARVAADATFTQVPVVADTFTQVPVVVGANLADGTQVYHSGRRQWGIVSAPDGITNNPGTHWVVFDGETDAAEVSDELLSVVVATRRRATTARKLSERPDGQAPPVIPGLNRRPVCGEPKMFAQAPEVCDNCGNLIDAHRSEFTPAVLEAMWKIMIRFGGPFNVHGGEIGKYAGDLMREHMAACAVDFTNTQEPTMDGCSVFVDSGSDNQPLAMLNGYLFCKCGKYRWEHIAVDDMTLGQLIWEIAHLDDDTNGTDGTDDGGRAGS